MTIVIAKAAPIAALEPRKKRRRKAPTDVSER
jgi:hypothetical protein